jgi:putative endonuclease
MDRQQIGTDAEQHAERFLIRQGLRPVARNYRCRQGEIDLIMHDGLTLVFIEVRLRKHQAYGSAAESVNLRKQQKLLLAARHYLQQQSHKTQPECRFDVIAFDGKEALSSPLWYKDAFRI